ncbi:hypothetical protein AX16_001972 [Volvariella volvacea WC 439]|nr:hypothetical protein AX16_001972 [Volvariella volvacea WC 439]
MSSPVNSFLVYNTLPLTPEEKSTLLRDLNRPPSHLNQPFRLPEEEHNTVGRSLEEVAQLHRSWRQRRGVAAGTTNARLIIAADEGLAPASHPRTVLIVNVEERDDDGSLQNIRVLASNALNVVTSIDAREHDWNEFWNVGKLNGGHYPGQ